VARTERLTTAATTDCKPSDRFADFRLIWIIRRKGFPAYFEPPQISGIPEPVIDLAGGSRMARFDNPTLLSQTIFLLLGLISPVVVGGAIVSTGRMSAIDAAHGNPINGLDEASLRLATLDNANLEIDVGIGALLLATTDAGSDRAECACLTAARQIAAQQPTRKATQTSNQCHALAVASKETSSSDGTVASASERARQSEELRAEITGFLPNIRGS
jgi:hypothetical protein